MLVKIFEFLSSALYSNPIIAISVSFVWGLLSVLLSPCHLSSIPLLIAFIGGQGKMPVKRAFLMSTVYSVGLLVMIAVIGVITGLAGMMLGNIGKIPVYIVAVIFILVGLNFLGVIPSMNFLSNSQPIVKSKGFLSAFLLGLLYGVALGPCTFGFMAPVLGVVLSSAKTNLIFSILLIISYAIGHCVLIIFAGTFTEQVEKLSKINEKTNIAAIIKKICGVIIIIVGIYLFF